MSTLQQRLMILCLFLLSASNSHATAVPTGAILISEILANPSAVADSNGEWFEIFNASMNSIDLNGLTISDDGSNSHTINAGGSLLIAPGEYFVLGNNGDVSSNGGYSANYVYTGFSLTNSSDQLIISDGMAEIIRLEYAGLPFGISGVSAELINQTINPQQGDYAATPNAPSFQFGDGDFGTPGRSGSVGLNTHAPVPVPGAIWLFGSVLLLALRKCFSFKIYCKPAFSLQN